MSVRLKPENLKKVTRLTALVKTINAAKSKCSPWNGLHRLLASGSKFRLLTTDGGDTCLEWNLLTEGSFEDEFDVTVDAGLFNAVAARSSDSHPIKLTCSGGLLTINQGQRDLKLRVQPTNIDPGNDPFTEVPAARPESWIYTTKMLADSLEFVTPFIDSNNENTTRAVATLEADGHMIAGSPKRVVQVTGLDPIPSPLNFKQETARRVHSFLDEIGESVRISIDLGRYTFSCPDREHRLTVEGEANGYSGKLDKLERLAYERLKVDRDMLSGSLAFLATVVPGEMKPLELRIRGHGQDATVQLSTLVQDESLRSTDEFDIIRTSHQPGVVDDAEGKPRGSTLGDSHLKINSARLREVLAKLSTHVLDVKYYPKLKFLLVTEEGGDLSGPSRSVLMTVQRDASQALSEPAPPVSADLVPTGAEPLQPLQDGDGQEPAPEVQIESPPTFNGSTDRFPARVNGTGCRPKGKQ